MRTSEAILVVGGAGYVGSHVAKLLHKQGYTPVVLDDLSTGHRGAVKFGPFVQGSCADAALVEKTLREHRIRTIMHFGAKALVGESIEKPLEYYSANVGSTLKLLEAALRAGVKRLIFSSTCATFGQPDEVPIHEGVAQQPVNPYGWSKFFVERILKDLHAAHGLQSALLRYFNAAGCDPDGELGELHTPETHLIPRALAAALGRGERLTVFGDDYPTSDGSCVRDYVHVNDLAWAHIQAMELLAKHDSSYDFNLGTTRGHSVFEVLKTVEKVTGRAVPFDVGPRRPGDPPVLVADASKAEKILGWKPEHDLESVVRTAARWMKENPSGFRG